MIIKVHKRPSPVKAQSRYRVLADGKRSRGALLDECMVQVNAGEWFGIVDSAIVNAQAKRPKSNIITITIETE